LEGSFSYKTEYIRLSEIILISSHQLIRFDHDWEREIVVKSNEYFKFPRELDMEPYTVRGVSRIEKQQEIIKEQQIKKQLEQDQLKQQQSVKIEPETKEQGDAKEGTQHVEADKNENPNNANISTQSIENEVQPEDDDDFDENSSSYSNNYKLVGIVVHSGQANGGR
jgi:hypothetical protein